MRKQVISSLFGLLGMSTTLYATTPFQFLDQGIVAGCGVVKGRVLNESGHPVTGAKVSSMVTDRPPRGRLTSSLTDAQGQFTLTCAQPGSNRVYVSNEDQSYPDTFLSPFVDAKLVPVVNVVEQGITEGVEVHLPPRGAKLVAQIIDAATQQPVDGANMTFCQADSPSKCLTINATSADGHFSMVLPSIRLRFKVSAPGYEDWYYKEGSASLRAAKILLTPGSSKRLTIPLRPKAKRPPKTKQ